MSLSKVTIIGHAGNDAELVTTKGDKKVAKFSIAVNEKVKNEKGEYVDKPQWYNVSAWDSLGENAAKIIKKGRQVYVEGKLVVREYMQDNIKKYSLDVVANTFQALGTKEDGSGSSTPASAPSNASSGSNKESVKSEPVPQMSNAEVNGTDDDLPF